MYLSGELNLMAGMLNFLQILCKIGFKTINSPEFISQTCTYSCCRYYIRALSLRNQPPLTTDLMTVHQQISYYYMRPKSSCLFSLADNWGLDPDPMILHVKRQLTNNIRREKGNRVEKMSNTEWALTCLLSTIRTPKRWHFKENYYVSGQQSEYIRCYTPFASLYFATVNFIEKQGVFCFAFQQ